MLSIVSDTVDEDDDLYDFVEDEDNEGDEIYEDLMRTEQPETVSASHSVVPQTAGSLRAASGNLQTLQVFDIRHFEL